MKLHTRSVTVIFIVLTYPQVFAQFSLISTVPERNSSGVPIHSVISLEFSSPVQQSTVSNCLYVASNLRASVDGLFSSEQDIVTFHPATPFYYGEKITVTVLPSLFSDSNIPVLPTAFTFTTEIKPSPAIPPAFADEELYRNGNQYVYQCTTADLDNDGDLDIIFSGNTELRWLENLGQNGFQEHSIWNISAFMYEVVAFDIDRDGDMDVLTATIPHGITLYINNGQQEFTRVLLTQGVYALSLDIADFDSNGLPDILYSDITDAVKKTYVLYNQGNNEFLNTVISDTKGVENRIVDIDGDGDWDIVQHDYSEVRYLLNTGTGFTAHTIAAPSYIYDIITADFDNDGDIDIVADEEGQVTLYVQTEGLQFVPKAIDTQSNHGVLGGGDLDGDQDFDLIVARYGQLFVLINDGDNNFMELEMLDRDVYPGVDPFNISTADLDQDGDLDIYSVVDYYRIKWFKNTTLEEAYPFSEVTHTIKSFTEGDADWGDYDNDGDLDLIMIGLHEHVPSVALYENQNGQFVEVQTSMPGLVYGSCDWGDYDNDGDLDLLLMGTTMPVPGTYAPAIFIYINEGNTFTLHQPSVEQLPKVEDGEARWADFNNDGRLDIIIHARGFSGIYQSDGAGNFSNAFEFTNVFQHGNVDVGDYDHDGDLDFVITGWGGNDNIGALLKVYKNEGDWIFTEALGNFTGRIGGNVNWADMDNDRDLDLVVSGNKRFYGGHTVPSITVYLNNDGYFQELENSEFLFNTDSYGTTAVGDFDNDGLPDVMASTRGGSSYSPELTLLRNNAPDDLQKVNLVLPKIASRVANWVDYDGDKDLDVYVQNSLLRNNGVKKNTPPDPPSQVEIDSVFNNTLYFHWSEGSDLENGAAGLSYQVYVGTEPIHQDVVNPQAEVSTGFRKIAQPGTVKGTRTHVSNLYGGTYYVGVQSVDAAFEGSVFTNAVSAFVVGIHGSAGACSGTEYSYTAKPSGNYTWQASGGAIISGQGTDSVVVRWNDAGRHHLKVTNGLDVKNTLVVDVDEQPNPKIIGGLTVCTGNEVYQVTDPQSHFVTWTVDGPNQLHEVHGLQATVNWKAPGEYQLISEAQPLHKGCSKFDTLLVKVDQRPVAKIEGPTQTCLQYVEIYTTSSDNAVWNVTNGTIVVDSVQKISVKWLNITGTGKIALRVNSANSYCSSRDSASITIYPIPAQPFLTVKGDTIISTPSQNGYYKWYYYDELVVWGPYQSLISDVPGIYQVEVFNLYGCGTKSSPLYYLITDISDKELEKHFSVYPNPAMENLSVELIDPHLGEALLTIYSSGFSVAKEQSLQKMDQKLLEIIDISALNSGLYILVLKINNQVYTTRFIKH